MAYIAHYHSVIFDHRCDRWTLPSRSLARSPLMLNGKGESSEWNTICSDMLLSLSPWHCSFVLWNVPRTIHIIIISLEPRWSEWSNWSRCSCFTMNQFRRRYCQIIDPSIQGFCVGPIVEKRICTPDNCCKSSFLKYFPRNLFFRCCKEMEESEIGQKSARLRYFAFSAVVVFEKASIMKCENAYSVRKRWMVAMERLECLFTWLWCSWTSD